MTQVDLFGQILENATTAVFGPREKGHRAAQQAAGKANRAIPGWVDLAVEITAWYARKSPAPFLLEQARQYAESQGLPTPPDKRSWGHVVQVLKAQHKIEACGYRAAVSSNGSPKVLWRWLS